MLGIRDSREIIEETWDALLCKAALPCSVDEYWSENGPLQIRSDSRRRYHRQFFRAKGIVISDYGELAVYMKDLSRMGIGFYSPVQLFPCDKIELRLAGREPLPLHVSRCRRLGENCFDCGSVFKGLNSHDPT